MRTVRIDVRALMATYALRGTTLKFYLLWVPRQPRVLAQGAAAGARRPRRRRRRRMERLGNFAETVRPPHVQQFQLAGVEVLLECTRVGNLSLRFDDEPEIGLRVTPIHFVSSEQSSSYACEVKTHNRGIRTATLIVQARQTPTRLEYAVSYRLLQDRTRAEWGHLTWRLDATLPLAAITASLPEVNDIVDLALELDLEGRPEPARIGLTLPKDVAEHRLHSSVVPRGEDVHLFIPYLTYRSHRLAYRIERMPADSYRYLQRVLRVAWAAPVAKLFRRVWLVGEVPYKAQDNGYHFFRHVRLNHPRRKIYYVIDPASPDRDRLLPLGNVLDRFSRRHIRYSFLASRLVASHHAEYLFASRDRPVARRTHGIRIFLQHGITASKNVTVIYARQRTLELPPERFVVASEREQRIVMEDYGYSAHQVPVVGFARFDALFAEHGPPARQVLVMPTWREQLRIDNFLDSDYFANWHGFLNHPRVQDLLREHDLEITFLLHPNLRAFADHFAIPHVRLIRQGEADVQALLTSSAVLITDFSSVAWDFSFLRRPVLYFQFDSETLVGARAPHVDPYRDYPGPIATTPDSLLNLLQQVVDDDLAMSPEYWARAQAFVKYRDTDNCARIYDAVRAAWGLRTALDRVRNVRWVQRRWWDFRRGPDYFPWMYRLFALGQVLPRRNTVVFECDRGARYGDAPRYLYERLIKRRHALQVLWVNNTTLRFDDPQTHKITRHSPTYYWQLSRARYWINNQNFPGELAKPRRTRFLQTWHGTPLKRMQHDVENMLSRDERYHDRAARLTSYWDALLSGSAYATRCFRSAFRFSGPILELGYPRNDLFSWPDAGERAKLARARLGLADDARKIMLYAPTFRDDERPGINWTQNLELDVERLSQEFGEEYVLVVRFHQLVRQSLREIPLSRPNFLVDGSTYPDIQELLLASDVLITDYSSVFFDWAVLGRPVLFFTYDLDRYRDVLRGFYLDFEAVAPGPLLRDNDELVGALKSLDEVEARYRDRLAEFRATYAPRDDGGASDRVLDAFFGRAIGPGSSPAPPDPAEQPLRRPRLAAGRGARPAR